MKSDKRKLQQICIHYFSFNVYKRASFACAARLADTLWAPEVTLNNYKGDSISKFVHHTGIIDIGRKITKFVNS